MPKQKQRRERKEVDKHGRSVFTVAYTLYFHAEPTNEQERLNLEFFSEQHSGAHRRVLLHNLLEQERLRLNWKPKQQVSPMETDVPSTFDGLEM